MVAQLIPCAANPFWHLSTGDQFEPCLEQANISPNLVTSHWQPFIIKHFSQLHHPSTASWPTVNHPLLLSTAATSSFLILYAASNQINTLRRWKLVKTFLHPAVPTHYYETIPSTSAATSCQFLSIKPYTAILHIAVRFSKTPGTQAFSQLPGSAVSH